MGTRKTTKKTDGSSVVTENGRIVGNLPSSQARRAPTASERPGPAYGSPQIPESQDPTYGAQSARLAADQADYLAKRKLFERRLDYPGETLADIVNAVREFEPDLDLASVTVQAFDDGMDVTFPSHETYREYKTRKREEARRRERRNATEVRRVERERAEYERLRALYGEE